MSLSLGAVVDCSSGQASSAAAHDVAAVPERRCLWCLRSLEVTQVRYCGKRCRQTAWRARRISVIEDTGDTPKRLAYADPPYPGLSRKYYRDEPSYAGEVDHVALVASLATRYDGWALSTSAEALRDVLPLCPPGSRVAAWVKPNGVSRKNRGASNTWEPVIYFQARRRPPGFRDWLSAKPARGGGTLMGRKPIAFCLWLFRLIGASPGDGFDDLFPGTGVVQSSWRQFQLGSASLTARAETSPMPASATAPNDVAGSRSVDLTSRGRP